MNTRRKAVLALLMALSWVASTAGVALAGLGGGAETEQNRFSWHPSITTSTVADDNTLLESSHSNSDFGIFITPRIELAYQGRWFDLGADLGADIRRYIDNSSPSDEFARLSGWAELGVLPGFTMRFANDYVPSSVDLASPEDHAANLVQTNRTIADFRYWSEVPSDGEITLSLQGVRLFSESFATEVAGNGIDDGFRSEYWEGSLVGEYQTPLVDRLSGFVRTNLRFRSFDDNSIGDFGDLAVVVGIRTDWFENLEFEMSGGYGLLGFYQADRSHGFVGDLNLRYFVRNGTVLRLSFQNQNVFDIIGNAFAETTVRFGVEHHFGERNAVEVALFSSRLDNKTWDSGVNYYAGVEANIRRQLSRRTQVELGYRYWRNAGDYSTDDFSLNQLLLTFTYRR
ncbi:MAG: outer membrane beta-barrel protein [Deltaproteobacteria bacterium]|nr:outer membrane beta-barrel protein [Deltaproteobacteria bacterium]